MKVNFNSIRKRAVLEMQELSKQLDNSIIKTTQWSKPNGIYHDQEVDIKGYVLVDAEEIENRVNSLLSLISTIACTYEEDNEDFKDLTEEIAEDIKWFNEEKDDE